MENQIKEAINYIKKISKKKLNFDTNANDPFFTHFWWATNRIHWKWYERWEIKNLNAEVKAVKSFIAERLYVIKKSIEDIKGQENTPNISVLIQSLKEELNYLRNENLTKTSIIKSLISKPMCSHQY